jgi:hypothetical protein
MSPKLEMDTALGLLDELRELHLNHPEAALRNVPAIALYNRSFNLGEAGGSAANAIDLIWYGVL